MKVTVKERIIRRIDKQISMTHNIRLLNNERYIYTKVKLFYYPYGTFAHAEILRMRICWSSPKNKYVNVPSLEVAVSPSNELYHQENSCTRIEKKRSWKV